MLSNIKKVKILDGSIGTQLNKYDTKQINNDPLWSSRALVNNPEAVIQIHSDYIRAGSDIIESNTYQASIPGFMKHLNLSKEESYELLKKAVKIAKTAIDNCESEGVFKDRSRTLIAGSMGPYGAYLNDASEYTGSYTDKVSLETLRDYHKPKMAALIEGGVDLLAIETLPSLKEAKLVTELLKEFPNIKAWLSFSCKPEGLCTVHGDDFASTALACYELNSEQIIGVGVNCIAPHAVEGLLKQVNKNRTNPIPLVVYANSGEKFDPEKGWDNKCEKFEDYVTTWLDLGVKYIGGCCRIGDDNIRKIKEKVTEWEKNHCVL